VPYPLARTLLLTTLPRGADVATFTLHLDSGESFPPLVHVDESLLVCHVA
jgi:hypothetical protein